MLIFADTCDLQEVSGLIKDGLCDGMTVNPTLLRKSFGTGLRITSFAKDALAVLDGRPLSLPVLADEHAEIGRQAMVLSDLAPNIYVKIPYWNTRRLPLLDIALRLVASDRNVNVTAVTTTEQVRSCWAILADRGATSHWFVSMFCGRISDKGIPAREFALCGSKMLSGSRGGLLWASTREAYNFYEADHARCEAITATPDLIRKWIRLREARLDELSLDAVRQFSVDAKELQI